MIWYTEILQIYSVIKKNILKYIIESFFRQTREVFLKTSSPWGQKKNCQTDFLKIYTSATEYSDFQSEIVAEKELNYYVLFLPKYFVNIRSHNNI